MPPTQPKEWKSFKVTKTLLVPLFILDILFITAVVTLTALSDINHGFVQINTPSEGFWQISLTWIFLPSIILQVFGLVVASAVDAFGFRQPFVELARGAPAAKSIALDYAAFFPIQREWKAFRNGHWHICIAFVVSLLVKIALGPLAARMMVEKPWYGTTKVTLSQDVVLYDNPDLTGSNGWDLERVLNTASATKVYGGSYPMWVDGNHTFLNFSLPHLPPGNTSSPNVTATTFSYYSRLDCQALDNLDDHVQIVNSSSGAILYVNGTDNGCFWKMNFLVTNDFTTYVQTSSNTSCGPYGDSGSSGRFIVAAGKISLSNLDNLDLTVISCVPTYWNSSGRLTMSLDPGLREPIQGWAEDAHSARELRPQWWTSFESQLSQVKAIDTTTDLNATSATEIGQLILDYTTRISSAPFSSKALINATQEIYATAYATLLDLYMIQEVGKSEQLQGDFTAVTNRLFVVNAFAGIILALLVAIAGVLASIYFYTASPSHRSVLFEEPIGLLGYAGLLANSTVNSLALSARNTEGFVGKTRKAVIQTLEALDEASNFHMVDSHDPQKARIIMQGKGLQNAEAATPFLEHQFKQESVGDRYAARGGVVARGQATLVSQETQPSTRSISPDSIEVRRLYGSETVDADS